MEEFPVAFRLKSLIEALGLSDSQFADRCGISRSTLSLLLSGKNKKISDIMLSQIHDAFPNVSIMWLLFGEGEKFELKETGQKEQKNKDEISLFPDNDQDGDGELNLVNAKQLENIIQEVVNKSFNSSFNKIEDLFKKEEDIILPRKVNKITVYYDDSTFETFIPEKKIVQ